MTYKIVDWTTAKGYVRKPVYWLRVRDKKFIRVTGIRRRGPNVRVTLENGVEFETGRDRPFYTPT